MSDDDGDRPHLRLVGEPGANAAPSDADPTPPARRPGDGASAELPDTRFRPGALATLNDLTGLVVMTVGRSGALDFAIASALTDNGAHLVVVDPEGDHARRVAWSASRDPGVGAVAVGMDPCQPAQVRQGISAIEQATERIDALVVTIELASLRVREGTVWYRPWELVPLVRAVARRMALHGGGWIVFVGAGTAADPAAGAMVAGAIDAWTRQASAEFSGGGVRVNAVIAAAAPGAAPTTEQRSSTRPVSSAVGSEDTAAPQPGRETTPPETASVRPAPARTAANPVGSRDGGATDPDEPTPLIPFPATSAPGNDQDNGRGTAAPEIIRDVAVATALVSLLSLGLRDLTGQVIYLGEQ